MRMAEGLAAYAPDLQTAARRALDQAVRLVGAEAGFVRVSGARILATLNLSEEEVERLSPAGELTGMTRSLLDVGDRQRHVVLVPAQSQNDVYLLGVVLGPFAPLFGSDEIARLSHFAALLRGSLDRVRLNEQIKRETARYEGLLQAVSDGGEGFVVT